MTFEELRERSLDELIAGSYGRENAIFAGQGNDQASAAAVIVRANDQNLGFEEYLQLHRTYLEKHGCSPEHIAEQLERVKDLKHYFQYD
jgi:hypothetical protein